MQIDGPKHKQRNIGKEDEKMEMTGREKLGKQM